MAKPFFIYGEKRDNNEWSHTLRPVTGEIRIVNKFALIIKQKRSIPYIEIAH
jgi:hypothetical protein